MGFGDMSAETLRAILGGVTVGDGLPVAIIGVLNVSPESFYAGSVHPDPDDLLRAADDMVAAGAAILDVGARSTAPYLPTEISEAEEADRLAAAIRRLADKCAVLLSADTSRATPARAALDAGAGIVNDVTGFHGDPAVAALVAARGASVILAADAAAATRAGGADPIETASRVLAESLAEARHAGVAAESQLLAAYQQWETQALTRFIGMFAFAILDTSRRSLVLARDYFGIKPLYYSRHANGFAEPFAHGSDERIHDEIAQDFEALDIDGINVRFYLKGVDHPTVVDQIERFGGAVLSWR